MSFAVCDFWLTLFMQSVLHDSPLSIGLHLLPATIGNIAMNIVAALILDRVNNRLLMGIASICLTISAILLATMRANSSYWAFIFPLLILSVVGADLIFNVGNVVQLVPSSQFDTNRCRCMSCLLCHRLSSL
jgi:MFS family permease